MRLVRGGKGGNNSGEPPQQPPTPEPEYEFNPSAEGLAIELPPPVRTRAILARQQKRRDPIIAEEQALFLRLKGYTVLQISQELECSTTHVRDLINRATERRKPELDKTYQQYIDEQLMQIELVMTEHMRRKWDPDSGRILVLLMERKAKLLGLDKPTKTEIVPPAAPRESEIDESLLTVDELKQLRTIIAACQERKARLPIEGQATPALEHQPEGGT